MPAARDDEPGPTPDVCGAGRGVAAGLLLAIVGLSLNFATPSHDPALFVAPAQVPTEPHLALLATDARGETTALPLLRCHADIRIEDGLARTELDLTFANVCASTSDGWLRVAMPARASMSRLAVHVAGQPVESVVRELDLAQQDYFSERPVTPALPRSPWGESSVLGLRIFEIEPGMETRVVIAYVERMAPRDGVATYALPALRTPDGEARNAAGLAAETSFGLRVVGGASLAPGAGWSSETHALQAACDDDDLLLAPATVASPLTRDLVLHIVDAATPDARLPRFTSFERDGVRYLMGRWRPDLALAVSRTRRDWIILVESDAGRDAATARAQVEIVRGMIAGAGRTDTVTLLTASTATRPLTPGPVAATAPSAADAIDRLRRTRNVGALDLGAAIDELRRAADAVTAPCIVHIGRGTPVLGERDPEALVSRLPGRAEYVGIAVGPVTPREFMRRAATRAGGLATSVRHDDPLALRGFNIGAALAATRLDDIAVTSDDAAPGEPALEARVFDPSVVAGGEAAFVARIEKGAPIPRRITIRGRSGSVPVTHTLDVTDVSAGSDELPREWARLEIGRLMDTGRPADRAPAIALSSSMFVPTPLTTLVVPRADGAGAGRADGRRGADSAAEAAALSAIPASARDVLESILVRGRVPLATEMPSLADAAPGTALHVTVRDLASTTRNDRDSWDADWTLRGDLLDPSPGSCRPDLKSPTLSDWAIHWRRYPIFGDARAAGVIGVPPMRPPSRQRSIELRRAAERLAYTYLGRGGDARSPAWILTPTPSIAHGEEARRSVLGVPIRRRIEDLLVPETPENTIGAADDLTRRLIRGDHDERPAGGGDAWVLLRDDWAASSVVSPRARVRRRPPWFSSAALRDLLQFCPAMNTWREDIAAALEMETADPAAASGVVEPEARALIDAARASGWTRVRVPGESGEVASDLLVDGAGRFVRTRTLAGGLREESSCDGSRMLHMYRELGLAAARRPSRHHLALLRDAAPWLVDTADDLARGADVRVRGESIVTVEPSGGARRLELEFAPDGALVGRRVVQREDGRLVAEERYERDAAGCVAVVVREANGAARTELTIDSVPAVEPDLAADETGLVVVPFPLRSEAWLAAHRSGDDVARLVSLIDEDDRRFAPVLNERFLARGDTRIGISVLAVAANDAWTTGGARRRIQPPDPRIAHPDAAVAHYIAARATEFAGPIDVGDAPGPFIRNLVELNDIVAEARDTPPSGPEERHAAVSALLRFAERTPFDVGAKAALDVIGRWRAWRPDYARAAQPIYARIARTSRLEYDSLYDAAAALIDSGDAGLIDEGATRLRAVYLDRVRRGRVPLTDESFARAVEAATPADRRVFVDACADELLRRGDHRGVLAMALQLSGPHRATEAAQHLVDRAAEGTSGEERRDLRIATSVLLAAAQTHSAAEPMIGELLRDADCARDPVVWEFYADCADTRESALRRREHALTLTFAPAGGESDLRHALAQCYHLLTAYTEIAYASEMGGASRADLAARIIDVADRARSLDPASVACCDKAATALGRLGRHDLAWEYVVSPVSAVPDDAGALHLLGEAVGAYGHTDLAVWALAEAFRIDPSDPRPLWTSAEILRNAHRRAEAIDLYDRISAGAWRAEFDDLKRAADAVPR